MKIAIIGYGKMGHAVEARAKSCGHTVVCTVDCPQEWELRDSELRSADVAVEFSTPSTAVDNIRRCWRLGLPVVCGTTGWDAQRKEVENECRANGCRLLAASNFSIGMNIMFDLNERLAALMSGRAEYSASITETHHIHKLDAPSGTALVLQRQIAGREVPITSIREGEVPGTHTVCYSSAIDTLSITHEAHSREGLAAGAVLAAEFLAAAAPGVYSMKDVING